MTTQEAIGAASHAANGLKDVAVAETSLSDVNGREGRLTIRGFDVEELAGKATFEEVAYLLWHGDLPSQQQLADFQDQIAGHRDLPEETEAAIRLASRRMQPMNALRFAVASLTAGSPGAEDASHEEKLELCTSILARVPVIVASYQRLREGKEVLQPRKDCGIASNFMYQLTGEDPDPAHVKGLDTYLVTVSDHGMNASTFTARVIASTDSDMVSAVTGAIGALKGRLHGGAPGPALGMIEAIGTPDRAEAWMRDAVARGQRLMGFGHRVYKVRDPRAEVLYQAAEQLADETGEREALALAKEIERVGVQVLAETKPGRNLNTNVEFYTALLLRELGLPRDLFSPVFAIGRTSGWLAHILEQQAEGRLIRPQSVYVGTYGRRYVPLNER